MNKFLQILKISFQQEFVYKLSFIMWRFRNVIQILVFFFLWNSVFRNTSEEVFGYSQQKIFTYAFVLILVRAVVLSSRSIDVAEIIANGDLTNIILKPVNFFKYWLTRDAGSKILNILFGIVEIIVLVFILKPNIFIQTNPIYILLFIISILIACLLFFTMTMTVSFAPFWIPEISWGAQFLFMSIFVEFLSGSFFPIDVFPESIFNILTLTPFPHMVFMPIKIYLGNFSYLEALKYLLIGIIWCFASWKLMFNIWKRGLLVYEGVGK